MKSSATMKSDHHSSANHRERIWGWDCSRIQRISISTSGYRIDWYADCFILWLINIEHVFVHPNADSGAMDFHAITNSDIACIHSVDPFRHFDVTVIVFIPLQISWIYQLPLLQQRLSSVRQVLVAAVINKTKKLEEKWDFLTSLKRKSKKKVIMTTAML